jgi:hypothetical protein
MRDSNIYRFGREWLRLGAEVLLLAATVALAAYTARLFGETKHVASETNRVATETKVVSTETAGLVAASVTDREVAEKHHRETLMPIVTYVGETSYVAPADRADKSPKGQLVYRGTLQNAGLGPAINVTAKWSTKYHSFDYLLQPIASGFRAEWTLFFDIEHDSREIMPRFLTFGLVVSYTDVFGQRAQTEHVNPGSPWSATTTKITAPAYQR